MMQKSAVSKERIAVGLEGDRFDGFNLGPCAVRGLVLSKVQKYYENQEKMIT